MSGLYLHVPFCRQACHYCNFHFSTSLQLRTPMLEAMMNELRIQKSYLCTPDSPSRDSGSQIPPIDTLYMGGGSPSILASSELDSLFSQIHKVFAVHEHAEITLEANPEDIDTPKLNAWKAMGINRISLGIQSFSDKLLHQLNRTHSSQTAWNSLERIQSIPFENISVDLIYGIPGLEDQDWLKTLQRVVQSGIVHISCYALTVEPKTALAHMIHKNQVPEPSQDQAARQFLLMTDFLQGNGYEHYEISNFAKPGWRSRHNSKYWSGSSYLGIGPSAHSFNGSSRQWNVANNAQYIRQLVEDVVPFERELLTPDMRHNEYIMTSLRTMEGCDLLTVKEQFSEAHQERLLKASTKFRNEGFMILESGHLRLTREGKLHADGIAASLFL